MNTRSTAVWNDGGCEQLLRYLHAWARHKIYFGASCMRRSLEAYAQVFNTACVDAGPQLCSAILQMKGRMPPEFCLSIAISDESLVYRFPHRHPDSVQRGKLNEHFLNAEARQGRLHTFMQSAGPHAQILLLPISHIYGTESLPGAAFFDTLGRFLDALPPQYQYAVELHNREYVLPEYFLLLEKRGIAHVLNHCATMPTVLEQIQLPRALTADVTVVRATPHMNAELRLGIIETVRRCINEGRSLYVYINDEPVNGSVPASVAALMEMLNADLAKLSPIKKQAA